MLTPRSMWACVVCAFTASFCSGCRPATSLPSSASAASSTEIAPRGMAADYDAAALVDGRKFMRVAPLDNPKMVPAMELRGLADDDYVLGIAVEGSFRAYPVRVLNYHHAVNDVVPATNGGKTPIAVTYCFSCNAGLCFNAMLDGKPRKLDFYGLYNGTAALCDRESGSVFLPVLGSIVNGPLRGAALKRIPVLDTTWSTWRTLHPDTLVMSLDTPFRGRYGNPSIPVQHLATDFPGPFFAPTVKRGDVRLSPFEPVVGVTVANSQGAPIRRAYPLGAIHAAKGALNDCIGSIPVVVMMDGQSITTAAYERTVRGRVVTLRPIRSKQQISGFLDNETRSEWNLAGRAVRGPLAGQGLTPVNSMLIQWFGWSGHFPNTTVYGINDPPAPWKPAAPARSG